MSASSLPCESARLATLRSLSVLDTLPEAETDGIARVASALFDAPIALVSLVDEDRQWFKAKLGVDICETGRDVSFCDHAIRDHAPMVVCDTADDPRFRENPFVTGETGIRFYAGVPIVVDGHAVGTVCVLDVRPRRPSDRQIEALSALALQAAALLKARRRAATYEEGERRFVAFLDHAPGVAFLKDEGGRMRFVNAAFERFFGLPASDVLGKTDHDWLPKEFADACAQDDARVRAIGRSVAFEETVRSGEGEERLWRTLKFPFKAEQGDWIGGIVVDITEQRAAERRVQEQNRELTDALQEAETARMASQVAAARFAQLFDGLPVACFSFGECGTIHEWNEAAESLWGVRAEEALLASIYETVVGPENHARTEEVVRRVFAGETVSGVERRETMRDGREAWLLTSTFPLRTPGGTIVGAVSANVDVTERKQTEDALRESESRFRAVVESLQEGLILQNAEGQILMWNESAERILGLTGEQLQARTALDPRWRPVHEDGSPFLAEERPGGRALATDLPQRPIQMGVHRPNGELRWLSVNAAPVTRDGSGRPTTAVSSFVDVTERVAQERLVQEQMAQISRYSAALELQKMELESANARLEGLASTDGLTGLPNHRTFQDFLRRKIDLCLSSDLPLSVVLLDVDRFKGYNDDFGHQAGDEVLRGVAAALAASVRGSDLAARYGGEEFVLVLPGLNAWGALAVAERARARLEATPFELRAITGSFGVATLGEGCRDAESLIRAADEALYRSKREGRNRVTHADEAWGLKAA